MYVPKLGIFFLMQQFVTDRKVDEEIGIISRFEADPDDVMPQIMGFGKGNCSIFQWLGDSLRLNSCLDMFFRDALRQISSLLLSAWSYAVMNIKHVYTSWEQNPAEVIERSKYRSQLFPSLSESCMSPDFSNSGEIKHELDSTFMEEPQQLLHTQKEEAAGNSNATDNHQTSDVTDHSPKSNATESSANSDIPENIPDDDTIENGSNLTENNPNEDTNENGSNVTENNPNEDTNENGSNVTENNPNEDTIENGSNLTENNPDDDTIENGSNVTENNPNEDTIENGSNLTENNPDDDTIENGSNVTENNPNEDTIENGSNLTENIPNSNVTNLEPVLETNNNATEKGTPTTKPIRRKSTSQLPKSLGITFPSTKSHETFRTSSQVKSISMSLPAKMAAGTREAKPRGRSHSIELPIASDFEELDQMRYSPKELAVIQDRVRHSLQRQGVVRPSYIKTVTLASTC